MRCCFRAAPADLNPCGDRSGLARKTTLVPDTSFEAIRKRLGTEPATLAEFEAEFGPVQPPDGEG